jgi:hypothetical protein
MRVVTMDRMVTYVEKTPRNLRGSTIGMLHALSGPRHLPNFDHGINYQLRD